MKVYAGANPIITKDQTIMLKKEDGDVMRVRLGLRITMLDGSWWTYCKRYGTWTRHRPGVIQRYRSGTVKYTDNGQVLRSPEQIDKFGTTKQLKRQMGHCPQLLVVLLNALDVYGYAVEG